MRNGEAPQTEPATQTSTQHSALGTQHSYSALRSRQSEDLCSQCHGVGWLRMDVPVHDPRFGRLYPCICRTHATEQRNLEELYHLSNLDAFQTKILGNFDPEASPSVRLACDIVREYADNPEGWLLLLGSYGTGKTHLAAAIANHVVQDHHMQVYFAVAPDLLHRLRAAYAPNSETTYDERFEQIRSVYLLVIDDLGAEQSTPWAVEKLYQIFNYRYNNRLPTVVTSNCDLDTLDPRIRSRLCDPDLCRFVFIEADDYRMRRMDARFITRGQGSGVRGQAQGRRPQQNPRGTNGPQGR
ncbi:MAG TPA: ATP-binding protein [Chloroflexia bacterium]|nr:ATP-binding protein [Chloroflexia bacterium]